jgi:hypothetical protein
MSRTNNKTKDNMNINKTQLVALLVALGFTKAPDWDDKKLLDRASQLPVKVPEDDIPKEFKKLYGSIADCPKDEELTFEGGARTLKAAKGEAPAKSKSKKKKAAAEDDAPEEETEAPAKSKKKKAASTEAAPKKTHPVDEYGCRVGSISAKVNAVITDEWQSEEEVADAAKVTLDQARGRLYYAATGDGKVLEKRRRTEYRLIPAKKK